MSLATFVLRLSLHIQDPCGQNADIFFLLCEEIGYEQVCDDATMTFRCDERVGQACAKRIAEFCDWNDTPSIK